MGCWRRKDPLYSGSVLNIMYRSAEASTLGLLCTEASFCMHRFFSFAGRYYTRLSSDFKIAAL